MAAIIDSAPDCVVHGQETNPDDMADFILQGPYEECAGIMTFGPGTTWGEEGAAAATGYYVLLGLGAAIMVAVFVAWILFENRRLVTYAGLRRGDTPPDAGVTSEGV